MCGIAGYFGFDTINDEVILATQKHLRHRGPNGNGIYKSSTTSGPWCLLLHSRLSIIDTSQLSSQPIHIAGHVLVYNGEIYNYLEIREQLIALGYKFHSSGDSEVLAVALYEWGISALERLEGMWSFAWYNKKTRRLILCRDRFGEKPLYYYRNGKGIYFASETQALSTLAGRKLPVNQEQILRFLVNGYKSLYKNKETFYIDVHEVPCSSALIVNENLSQNLLNYWRPCFSSQQALSFDDAVEIAKHALEKAVMLRLRSDVPLAFCMSGGIDSNAIIGIANSLSQHDVHGFSIVSSDQRYNETREIQASLRHLNIRHTAVFVDNVNFIQNLRSLVKSHDAPVFTISYYLHAKLLESISASGYKVSISGTGADEIFSGYFDHFMYYLRDVRAFPDVFDKTFREWKMFIRKDIRNPLLKNPDYILADPEARRHIFLNSDVFSSYMKQPWSEPFSEVKFCDSELRNRMLNEIFYESVPVILHEDDLNSMRVSVENRSPFLDKNLFEVIYSLPVEHLMKGCWSKALLREACRPYIANEVLSKRQKVGFNAALEDLLDVSDPFTIDFLLSESAIYDIVDRASIEDLIMKSQPWPNDISKFLFSFIGCKMFIEQNE
jgi:asparagine synthase (glutamine-hydrolysing)